jgi:hypothetical protein
VAAHDPEELADHALRRPVGEADDTAGGRAHANELGRGDRVARRELDADN